VAIVPGTARARLVPTLEGTGTRTPARSVGLSTCAAYSRGQYQSFGRAESRRRLIWWSRTLDTLSTVEMCPVLAAAPVVRVLACRGFTSGAGRRIAGRAGVPGTSCEAGSGTGHSTCRSFDQRCVFTRPKPVVWACRESSAPHLVVEDPRHVCNRRNVPGGRHRVRSAGSNLPRVHQRRRAALAGGAGVPGVSCEAGCGCRSRRPDVFGHRSVVEDLHRPNKANDDSR
jgi:hypothetical protein